MLSRFARLTSCRIAARLLLQAAQFTGLRCRPSTIEDLPALTLWRFALLTLAATCVWHSPVRSEPAPRPNVVLVMTDDQGYGDLGCHGNPALRTPNIDRFYGDSVRLTNFHVSPTCSPTRGALLTGRYANRVGTWHTIMGRSLLQAGERTIADTLRAGGYRTGMFGKWHLGENYPFRPQDRGFDDTLTFGGGAIGNAQDYWGNDYFDDTYLRNGRPERFKGYCTDIWFQEAIRFVEANRDAPFFLYVPTNAPHGPFLVPDRFTRRYAAQGIRSPLAEFYGMIESIDENFGLLIRKLDELGLGDRTIVVFMTDNGSTMGDRAFNAGMRGGKGSEYEGGHRVPFFIRWPAGGISGGRDIDTLAAHIDVLPTIAELAGLTVPRQPSLDGTSLAPLLLGKTTEWPNRTVITDSQRIDFPRKWRKSAVMDRRWRLINGEELYDLQTDSGQSRDVSEGHPEVVSRLRSAYDAWWSDLQPSLSDYARIVLGSESQNPTWLSTHDIHGEVVWLHSQVEAGLRADGFWAVAVERPGLYEIRLRRWPAEVDRPINQRLVRSRKVREGRPESVVDGVTAARLSIGEHDVTQPLAPGGRTATFRLPLRAGPTRLQAWFVHEEGAVHGAYYVGVERIAD